jgi:hypothetical protein
MNKSDVETLIDSFANTNVTRDRGIYFDQTSYSCVRSDDKSIYAKDDKKGIILVQTGKYVLFGAYKENMYPSVCIEALEKLGKLLDCQCFYNCSSFYNFNNNKKVIISDKRRVKLE